MDMAEIKVIRQHLIDPEICIRCNTCEATCPVNAITHDDRNYVVRADSVSRVEGWLRDTLPASSFDVPGISLDDLPKWEIWELEDQDDAKHPWRP